MNPRILLRLSPLIFLSILLFPARPQNKGEVDDVRNAFLVTRVRVPAQKPSKPATVSPAKGRKQDSKMNIPLGLGYTIYQQDANGNPIRVSESREFHQGDEVRLVLESNINGYLYVFYTENDGPSEMLFPDARLNAGRNTIKAHVPYEVPSSRESNPSLRWFKFNENPAIERLYLVVAKTPLARVPIGNELVAFCRANANACPWRPTDTGWTEIAANTDSVREDKSGALGQTFTTVEREAVDRGLGLGLDSPAPSVIRMSKSLQASRLVTKVALVHK